MTRKKYYSLRSYFSYLATFKYRFFLVLSVFLVSDIFLAVIPIFIGQFVGALAANPISKDAVYMYTGILIFLSIAHDLSWKTAEVLYLKVINSRIYRYQNIVFYSVINKRYPYFVGKFTGKISSYINDLDREFREFVEAIFYTYADLVVKLPALIAIMFTVNWLTGLIFTVSITAMLITGTILVKRMRIAEKKFTDIKSGLDGYIIDVISNFVSVKAFRKEEVEHEYIADKRKEVISAANTSFLWASIFWQTLSIFVRYIIWPGTILLNVHLYLKGDISLAEITTFIAALTIFSDYIWGVIWSISQFNLKLARIEESHQYLFQDRNIVKDYYAQHHNTSNKKPIKFIESLALSHLTFSYPDKKDHAVLRDIHVTIRKNEKIGIVGKSGSGKTTLIKLLLGYYKTHDGSVIIDGQPIDNRTLVELISYVPQDTALFHRSIKENISYSANEKVDDDMVVQAARRAYADEFIVEAADGYDSLVGERGIKLSMGQRQRIAIARAFLDDKPILVLDEATSALDSESEVLVQKALEDLWHDKTVIAIAHRLSTLRNMDRIIVMESGEIIEQGSHKELLAAQGQYYRLWQHQSGGVIADD